MSNDTFKIDFGFYKTAADVDEQPFQTHLVEENCGDIIVIDGQTIVLEVVNLALANSKVVFADVTILPEDSTVIQPRIEAAKGIYCQVEVILPALPRRVHPQNKTCSECQLWNREKGIEELNHITQVFADQRQLKMQREVIDQVAINHNKAMMCDENVGYCPRNYSLVCDVSPACEEGFIQK